MQGYGVAALYNMVALVLVAGRDDTLLMVQEARLDCRGTYYPPAGRAADGEDPMQTAVRVTRQKTGLDIEVEGLLGVEHNLPVGRFPGQIRFIVRGVVVGGRLRTHQDEHALDAMWVRLPDVARLRLRSDDFVPWAQDELAGLLQTMPLSSWRSVGHR